MSEKNIVINVTDNRNVTVSSKSCEGQDLYNGLCAYLVHLKKHLVDPNALDYMVRKALEDTEKVIRANSATETSYDFGKNNN